MKIMKNILRTGLILLAGLLALVTPLRADNPPTYLFQINPSAVPRGFQAAGVAVDSSNNVYVTDEKNIRVVKFASNGTYLSQWGSAGTNNGQFENPGGIAVDGSNNVYAGDFVNDRVEKFDSNGNYLTKWGSFGSGNGQFNLPEGVAVDRSNNVYVVDLSNDRVEKFDSNGNYLTKWGSFGSGNGQFNLPEGVAVDRSNNVYVVDLSNDRVEKFDSNGNYLTKWGSFGSGNGQFEAPQGIAVDSSNNVYVADFGNNRVDKFDSNGNYLTQWGIQSTGIAVDSTWNFIYVIDDNGISPIQVFVNLPMLNPASADGQLILNWVNSTFSLQSAPALTGPWTTLTNATSPYTVPITAPQQFFRLFYP